MDTDLTKGPVMRSMLRFAVPMILGNLLQQCYNVVDTLIVSWYLGPDALAAVGSSFTLMTFITSILLGLCMGSSVVFSIRFGRRDDRGLRESAQASFFLILSITLILNLIAFFSLDGIRLFLNVSDDGIWQMMRSYLFVIYSGLIGTFLYNYFSSYLRAIGDSVSPLIFLGISAVLNIFLDILFVVFFNRGVAGAAEATVISQYVSGIGIGIFAMFRYPQLRPRRGDKLVCLSNIKEIASFSILTCVQQSVMNLGILLVQGLVNSFGPVVMAAFAAAVKIDSFAYMPVQEFGNAFSTFIAQNYGAKQKDRIRSGLKGAIIASFVFSVAISLLIWIFGSQLMNLFVDESERDIIYEGLRYLRIEGTFYCGIGCLFLLYGLYRALEKPGMSVILTIFSLGTRVALAYVLSSIEPVGVVGIWWSVPIGWFIADCVGILYYVFRKKALLYWA